MDMSIIESLASYVPMQLLRLLIANPVPARRPSDTHFDAAVLFVQIEGFDALFSRLANNDPENRLFQILNTYFSIFVDDVKAEGGDILGFAGDRALVLWPVSNINRRHGSVTALASVTRRAAQCALSLQKMLHNYEALDDLCLKLRIGVGAGKVFTASVGGALGRWEFLGSGEAVIQTYVIVDTANTGDILLSPQAYALMRTQCVGKELPDGNFRLENVRFPLPSQSLETVRLVPEIAAPLRAYIPGAVLNSVTTGQTGWLSEMREVTVLYINLPHITHTTALEEIHNAMRTMQRALYRQTGSVSKLFLSQKGLILVAVLGVPPLIYEDNAARGVLAALLISQELRQIGYDHKIGIATDMAYCCSIGNSRRREYTMIGTVGVMAERLMNNISDGVPPVLCDAHSYEMSLDRVEFAPPTVLNFDDTGSQSVYRPLSTR